VSPQHAESADTELWPSVHTPASKQSAYDLPALERERPERTPLIPRWAYLAALGTAVAVLLVVGLTLWATSSAQVVVPEVTGVSLQVAQTRLAQAGLESRVTDRRFSAAPRDEVLDQSPTGGESLRRGDVVDLVVSAGTEEFVMPDVIGNGLALAVGTLEARGLLVRIETVVSEEPSDTVLSSNPAPGVIVRTGDPVLLTVATTAGAQRGLRPFDMEGISVVIDPAPTTASDIDASMEIARRLRSLLQASGAEVTMLRSAADTAVADPERAEAASLTTPTVSVGLYTDGEGSPGRIVIRPATGTPDLLQRSSLLASAVASQLAEVASPVSASVSTTETVLTQTNSPWVRVRLGSEDVREERNRLADPRWADSIARAIYTALGEVLGRPLEQ
jgi:N-acetylmuramoyl-L-alanine amidase